MAKKPDKPIYAFIRRGDALIPEMEFDTHALDGISQGQRVKIEIKEFRNLDRHRAYWAMLHDVVAATECALTPERLHDVIKLEAGLIEHVRLPNGFMVALPGSRSTEYVRADLLATTQRELAEARAHGHDSFKLACMWQDQAKEARARADSLERERDDLALRALTIDEALTNSIQLREASDRRIEALEKALRDAKAFHDRDSGCNGFTADYEILRLEIDAALTPDTAEEHHDG